MSGGLVTARRSGATAINAAQIGRLGLMFNIGAPFELVQIVVHDRNGACEPIVIDQNFSRNRIFLRSQIVCLPSFGQHARWRGINGRDVAAIYAMPAVVAHRPILIVVRQKRLAHRDDGNPKRRIWLRSWVGLLEHDSGFLRLDGPEIQSRHLAEVINRFERSIFVAVLDDSFGLRSQQQQPSF